MTAPLTREHIEGWMEQVSEGNITLATDDMRALCDLALKGLRAEEAPTGEAVRYGVARLKALIPLRIPNYELPADSFLEEAVRDILRGGVNNGERDG